MRNLRQRARKPLTTSLPTASELFEGSNVPTKAQRKDLKKYLTSTSHPKTEVASRLGNMSLNKASVEAFFEKVKPYQLALA